MPIYEYLCDGCADRFEVKQSMKDDALTTCPKCGKHVQRLISSPAIMFKGSGWYVTDYSDKMKPSSGSEPPAPKTGEKKEAAPSTAEQTTSAAPATPASPRIRAGRYPIESDPGGLQHHDNRTLVFRCQVGSGARCASASPSLRLSSWREPSAQPWPMAWARQASAW